LAASAAALCFALTSAASAQADDDTPLALDPERIQLSRVVLIDAGLPERATGMDAPTDMSGIDTNVRSMVNSGQASPMAGAAGGLIAGLLIAAVDAGVDSNRNGKIEKMLAARSFDGRAIFETAFESALTEGRLETSKKSVARAKGYFAKVTPEPDAPHDAFVDVLIHQYGFAIDGATWYPSVSLQVKVNDVQSGDLLMNESLVYGRPGLRPPFQNLQTGERKATPGPLMIVIPYALNQGFSSVDAYTEEDPERAVAALTEALQTTAKAAARLVLAAAPPPPATLEAVPEEPPAEVAAEVRADEAVAPLESAAPAEPA
jgi:hypothetical protein